MSVTVRKKNDFFYEQCLNICHKRIVGLLHQFSFSPRQKEDLLSEATIAFWETIEDFQKKNGKKHGKDIHQFVDGIWSYSRKTIRGRWEDYLIRAIGSISRYDYYILRRIHTIHDAISQEEQSRVTAQKLAQRIALERKKETPGKMVLPAKYEDPGEVEGILQKLGDFRLSYLEEVLSTLPFPEEEVSLDCDIFLDRAVYRKMAADILAHLPTAAQRVLHRKFVRGEKHHAIAAFLQISEGVSKNSLQNALGNLRNLLAGYPAEDHLGICYALLEIVEEDEKYLEKIQSSIEYTEETGLLFQQVKQELVRKFQNG